MEVYSTNDLLYGAGDASHFKLCKYLFVGFLIISNLHGLSRARKWREN